jgi:excisionase family DNA binding protein
MIMNERVLYTLAQVAQLLGVHYETAARWVCTGKLHGIKLSRRKVVVQQLEAFLAGGTSTAGSAQRWMALARMVTSQEAEQLRAFTQDFEHVEVAG